MISESKATEIYCMADDFLPSFDAQVAKYTIKPGEKRKYHRDSTLSKAEVMVIMILFYDSNYRCLKHFYLQHVCQNLRHLFPKVVSYIRLVELEHEMNIQ
ncbi:iSPg3 transposase [Prevotella sp. CAG:924]|nr:iSPg3 transposase [Prevotella sp. CAG:924]